MVLFCSTLHLSLLCSHIEDIAISVIVVLSFVRSQSTLRIRLLEFYKLKGCLLQKQITLYAFLGPGSSQVVHMMCACRSRRHLIAQLLCSCKLTAAKLLPKFTFMGFDAYKCTKRHIAISTSTSPRSTHSYEPPVYIGLDADTY